MKRKAFKRTSRKDIYDVCKAYVTGQLSIKDRNKLIRSWTPYNYYNNTGRPINSGDEVFITGCLFAGATAGKCFDRVANKKSLIILGEVPTPTHDVSDYSQEAIEEREVINSLKLTSSIELSTGGVHCESSLAPVDFGFKHIGKHGESIIPTFKPCLWVSELVNDSNTGKNLGIDVGSEWTYYIRKREGARIRFLDLNDEESLYYSTYIPVVANNMVNADQKDIDKAGLEIIIDSSYGIGFDSPETIASVSRQLPFYSGIFDDFSYNGISFKEKLIWQEGLFSSSDEYLCFFYALTLPYEKEENTYNWPAITSDNAAIPKETFAFVEDIHNKATIEESIELAKNKKIIFSVKKKLDGDKNKEYKKVTTKTRVPVANDEGRCGSIEIEKITFSQIIINNDGHKFTLGDESVEKDGEYFILGKSLPETISGKKQCYCALIPIESVPEFSGSKIRVFHVSANWTFTGNDYSAAANKISTTEGEFLYSPMSKTGDSITANTVVVAYKDDELDKWILINAACN